MAKLLVGVIFGGQSGEHEVSLNSTRLTIASLDREKYEVVAIGIAKDGTWVTGAEALQMIEAPAVARELAAAIDEAAEYGLLTGKAEDLPTTHLH